MWAIMCVRFIFLFNLDDIHNYLPFPHSFILINVYQILLMRGPLDPTPLAVPLCMFNTLIVIYL